MRLQDVASAANVSFITAWRAMNAPHLVRESTLARVRKAADDLGYVANAVARSLATQRAGVIGVIVPTIEDSIFSATVQGLSDTLVGDGMELLVGVDGYSLTREEELVRAFVGRQVDALVLTGQAHTPATRTILEKAQLTVLEIWEIPERPIDLYVGFSNHAMIAAATGELVGRGYRNIAYASVEGRGRSGQRRAGYEAAMAAAGLAPHFVLAEATLEGGVAAMDAALASPRPVDAILFNGDTLAVGAHLAGRERGLRFPDDLALMGVHDTPIASHIRPALSTVRIPRYEIGVHAAEAIRARLAGTPDVPSVAVEYAIVLRGTT